MIDDRSLFPNGEALDAHARLRDTLLLSLVSGVGPRSWRALLDHFGSASAVLAAAPSVLREVKGVGPKLAAAIARGPSSIDVDATLKRCREQQVDILTLDAPGYPPSLAEIYDPPPILYQRGQWRSEDAMAVAIVGSRHATHYGVTIAEKLAASLARAGLTIISGLARGIDAAAHRGALEAGGRTIAVLGSGVLNIFPPEHEKLAEEVSQAGAVMSEAHVDGEPLAAMFPQRNRLISGMSLGIIVVEAAERSGALITARHAMEQGREVFAVPGRIDSRASRGCHRLIRDGATLVETADDVLESLGPLVKPTTNAAGRTIHSPAELLLNDLEQRVLDVIETQATPIDTLIARTSLAAPQVLAILSALEMRRLIRRVSGSLVLRV